MSLTEITLNGTLNPDGSLELDQKPNLTPGRVTVILRRETEEIAQPQEDWFQFLQNARKKMEEAGCHFMDEKEMQEHLDWLRESDRIDDLLQETAEQRPKPEKP